MHVGKVQMSTSHCIIQNHKNNNQVLRYHNCCKSITAYTTAKDARNFCTFDAPQKTVIMLEFTVAFMNIIKNGRHKNAH